MHSNHFTPNEWDAGVWTADYGLRSRSWRAAFTWIPSPVGLAAVGETWPCPHFLHVRSLYALGNVSTLVPRSERPPSTVMDLLSETCPV